MDNTDLATYLDALENGELHYFRDNAYKKAPKICAGVYTIWRDRELIYVGMSGRSMNAEIIENHRNNNSKAKGLTKRLKSHTEGRRSGDQFCVYVGDRLVLPTLTKTDIEQIADGKLSFDKLIKDYIHANLTFRFVETENDKIAYKLENAIKSGALKSGNPF
jgi:hypothetical protein